jgi:hypothetical protein
MTDGRNLMSICTIELKYTIKVTRFYQQTDSKQYVRYSGFGTWIKKSQINLQCGEGA